MYMALEEEAIGAMVAQADEAGVEHAIYHLSKKLLPYEIKYDIVQKTCLAVIWATQTQTLFPILPSRGGG